ncbi:MAG: agmatinase [Bacillota bacterium]|nr:agmatinase [Bacillota bacterium]
MKGRFRRGGRFLGAVPLEEARAVLVGMPLDATTSFRGGTREAPARVREVSDVLEAYSLELDRGLDRHPLADAGDVELVPGNVALSLERIEEAVDGLLEAGKLPLGVGGEHLASLGTFRALARRYPELHVIHLDAHADLRDRYEGEALSHATVLRRIAEALPPGRVHQFGIRSAVPEEMEFARERTELVPVEVLEPVRRLVGSGRLAGAPVFLTVDIDVVDPAYAPGTGAPEPGGIGSRELLQALYALAPLQVVAFDVMEISPPRDLSERTSILGAKLIREAALLWG